jgi:tRNA (cmo5U34)-methyltransferase
MISHDLKCNYTFMKVAKMICLLDRQINSAESWTCPKLMSSDNLLDRTPGIHTPQLTSNMSNPKSAIVFDKEMAARYDKSSAKFAQIRDAIFLLIRTILSNLPVNARILCVGVGTGSELLDLAQAFPQWQFTAVEPSAPMLDICRQRMEDNGITSRCTFHEGYLDSLPPADSFDAATCLFVSHFITQPDERSNLFHQIALRLRPQGYLINADLAYDLSASDYPGILEIWLQMISPAEAPAAEIEKMRQAYGTVVAVLPPAVVASIIAAGGFDAPVLCFQSLMMHAWYTRRAAIPQVN